VWMAMGLPQVLGSPWCQRWKEQRVHRSSSEGRAHAQGLCSTNAALHPCLKRFVARSNLSALLGDRVIALPASTSELL